MSKIDKYKAFCNVKQIIHLIPFGMLRKSLISSKFILSNLVKMCSHYYLY